MTGLVPEEKRMVTLVPCSSSSKGKSVVETETLPSPCDDETKDEEEWVDLSDDDDRTLSDYQREFEEFFEQHAHISDDGEFEREFSKEVLRRAFYVPEEKRSKLLIQKEKLWRLNVLLNRRPDITHDSSSEDVFQKLVNEGLINNIPKEEALGYINDAILTREHFYQDDLSFEIIKKLITAVPLIKIDSYKHYSSSRVASFVRKMGLPNITSTMIEYPLYYIKHELSRIIDDKIHPVVYMERIKETLFVVENDAKRNRRKNIQCWKNRQSRYFADEKKREEAEIENSEDYQNALKVVQLHQEFHNHLASCLFIKHDMKIKNLLKDKRVVQRRFERLDNTLIKASLKARIKLLKKFNEVDAYYAWLAELINCKIKEGRSRMDEILQSITVEHPDFPELPEKWFFRRIKDIPHGWTDKEKKEELSLFYGLLDKVKEHTRCPLSYAFVIEGIVDYMYACPIIEDVKKPEEFEDPLCYIRSLIFSTRHGWLMDMAWDETFYDHPDYTIVYEDMSTLV